MKNSNPKYWVLEKKVFLAEIETTAEGGWGGLAGAEGGRGELRVQVAGMIRSSETEV